MRGDKGLIKKDKIQEILNKKEMDEFPVENDYFQQVSKKNTSLMVVICKEERSLYFQLMKQDSDVLFCEDLRYIVSINHLDNVKDIFLDVGSFSDLDEIYYLARQFYILHSGCNIVLIR